MQQLFRRVLPIGLLAIALIASLIWGMTERRRQEAYRINLENMYERSFYELVDGVGNLEVQIGKLLITETPGSSLTLLSDIRHVADGAQASLGILPLQNSQDTAKFINQVGDYCNSLSQRVAQGQPITHEQRAQLLEMKERLTSLGNKMRDLQAEAAQGDTSLWSVSLDAATGAQDAADSVDSPLATVGHTGIDYPALVYDGPFSDSADTPPRGLTGAWIDYEEAERIARLFIGESRVEWTAPSSESMGDIPAFGVEMMLSRDGVVTVQVTKQGGHILWIMPERTPSRVDFDLNQCYDAALAFLSANGYPDVTLSYYQAYDNIAVFNLVPIQDGVLLYPDLIKIQISMETGQVIGLEAGNYLRNHIERELPEVIESLEDALLLATRLEVQKTQLALIPKLNEEILCHEITGTFMDEPYILYVDAQTGREINLLKIIDVEGGQLAM